MILKRAQIYMSILSLIAAATSNADDVPKRFNFDRYQAMMDRSPFAVATAVAMPAATPDFAKDLYVANAAKSSDGDLVTIASSADKNFKKYLTTKEPMDGYGIANIEWSERVGATKVTISKDGKFATLSFNQALLAQPASNAPNAPAVPNVPTPAGIVQPGGATPGQTNFPKPAPIPSIPNQRVRGVIQKNPAAPAQAVTPPPQPNDMPES
ncbi:MAG: hypothetical protein QOI22_2081 [Verrucomicrobiota bacterium]|jgi:hypothetical protein